jgi:hypothetical protein
LGNGRREAQAKAEASLSMLGQLRWLSDILAWPKRQRLETMVPPAIGDMGGGEEIYRRGQSQGGVPINGARLNRFLASRWQPRGHLAKPLG